jgi:hypothetical protein
VLSPAEEISVRELVSRTTEQLQRASAGPDDMGSRYARLLELLWNPHHSKKAVSLEAQPSNDNKEISMASLASSVPGQPSMYFSPANDFSWLDLGAVGDYVSGDQMTAGLLGYDGLQDNSIYGGAVSQQIWQTPLWMNENMPNSLLF